MSDEEVMEDLFLDDDGKLDNEPIGKVDLRLRTFQDMGRLCRLFLRAFFDHDECLALQKVSVFLLSQLSK